MRRVYYSTWKKRNMKFEVSCARDHIKQQTDGHRHKVSSIHAFYFQAEGWEVYKQVCYVTYVTYVGYVGYVGYVTKKWKLSATKYRIFLDIVSGCQISSRFWHLENFSRNFDFENVLIFLID